MRDDLLLYYERELDYLRNAGKKFADKYPKVASRLALEPNKCDDPHVERLLEGFAFLAARVHLKMDDEFPEITEALLSVVYPELVRPLPSMSIVQFQLDPKKGKLTSGLRIERNSALETKEVSNDRCKFRTCYETTIWPLTVTAAEWRAPSRLQTAVKTNDSAWAIRLELRCAPGIAFPALKLDKLRFYLDGESGLVNMIYELLCSRLTRVLIRDPSAGSRLAPIVLPASALSAVGFEADQGMLPYAPSSFSGHRLLLEYFAFPEKFFFIDLCGLEGIASAGFSDVIEFVFLISQVEGEGRIQRIELELSEKTFRLGCTPIVNLFSETAEPIRLEQRKAEYPITYSRRRTSKEVFSIDEVNAVNSNSQIITRYEPFYSLRHSGRRPDQSGYWLARRRPSNRDGHEGIETTISLLDLTSASLEPDAWSLAVRTTCTNDDLPSRLPFGNQDSDFEMDGAAAMKRIIALRKPTQVVRPEARKAALWRLVSHLSLNYLSLVDQGKEALQEMLRLYDVGRTAYSQNVIQSILHIRSHPQFTRLVSEQGVSFARGVRIEMELDEDQFAGGGAFLFANVLERFFGLSASLNSFTQLSVTTPQRKGVLHEWQPRSGRRPLL